MNKKTNKILSFLQNNKKTLAFALVGLVGFAGVSQMSASASTDLENSDDILLTEEVYQQILADGGSIVFDDDSMDTESPEDFLLTKEVYQQILADGGSIVFEDDSMDTESPEDFLLTKEVYQQILADGGSIILDDASASIEDYLQ